jgi:hypothetical protein
MAPVRTQFARLACDAGGTQAWVVEAFFLMRQSVGAGQSAGKSAVDERETRRRNPESCHELCRYGQLHPDNPPFQHNEDQNDSTRRFLAEYVGAS